jgi:hypothetical protein
MMATPNETSASQMILEIHRVSFSKPIRGWRVKVTIAGPAKDPKHNS